MISLSKLTAEQRNKYWKNIGISFYILIGIMVPNVFIKEWCNVKWANPIMEMTILLVVPLLYAAIANSSIRTPGSLRFNTVVCILISLVIAILLLVGNYYNAFKVIENNMISDSIWGIVYLFAWDMYFIVCIVKTLIMNRKH